MISATRFSCYVQCIGDSHQSCICHEIGAGICNVPVAGALATDSVSSYNCTVGPLDVTRQFVDMAQSPDLRRQPARGIVHCSVVQQPLLVMAEAQWTVIIRCDMNQDR